VPLLGGGTDLTLLSKKSSLVGDGCGCFAFGGLLQKHQNKPIYIFLKYK
jgi:hypothetical protein